MKVIDSIKQYLHHIFITAKKSEEIHEGINNQSDLINNKMNDVHQGINNQTDLINQKMKGIHEGINNQSALINRKMNELIEQMNRLVTIISVTPLAPSIQGAYNVNDGHQAPPRANFEDIMKRHPLMFARKTYNTNHPDYNPEEARNFPGKIFNMDKDAGNPVYAELKKLIQDNEIAESQWGAILRETLEEARSVPHAEQIFERKAYVERYIDELQTKFGGCYQPGWVNLEDALFLYWIVRKLKPKTIVQTGVCNGLSSSFMMLALAKNGPEGTLHVVDMPPIFDSKDPKWTVRGKAYGVIIPEGKSSGWLVPDAYRDRFEVLNGDAKDLLPGLLKKVGSIDMFYHDSDHTYDHMMFEFVEAKKYLTKHGVMVSDDISWNASLWDFADQYLAPAYNYRGSMGIACF